MTARTLRELLDDAGKPRREATPEAVKHAAMFRRLADQIEAGE